MLTENEIQALPNNDPRKIAFKLGYDHGYADGYESGFDWPHPPEQESNPYYMLGYENGQFEGSTDS